jgi:hypothetical protein
MELENFESISLQQHTLFMMSVVEDGDDNWFWFIELANGDDSQIENFFNDNPCELKTAKYATTKRFIKYEHAIADILGIIEIMGVPYQSETSFSVYVRDPEGNVTFDFTDDVYSEKTGFFNNGEFTCD